MSTFYLTPGNAVSCYINTHRNGWDGEICAHADTWNCAATPEFRRDYCTRGHARCYHIHTFHAPTPNFVMDDYGAGWILGKNDHVLDDQLLLILAREGVEPRGIREDYRRRYKVAGAYRIQDVRRVEQGHRVLWEVHPHDDGWTRFPGFEVDSPRFEHAGGPYVKQIDRELVLRVFDDAAEAATSPEPAWHEPADKDRFEHFMQHLGEWLDEAARSAARLPQRETWRAMAAKATHTVGEQGQGPLADLPQMIRGNGDKVVGEVRGASRSAEILSIDGDPLLRRPALLEEGRRQWVQQTYGTAAYQAIEVASRTKEVLILRGTPGVGKSHLSLRLLDDPDRERTLVVPVGATWRGREDLLGYVSPVTNEFEPTPFTDFLFAAAAAWRDDDPRARVVVFEEFNLSQPEHWLSDVLVVSQHRQEKDRYLHLGGGRVRGQSDGDCRLFLSPAVRFVATVNSDHTVRPLSPRILDRAALVDLRREPRQSLAQAGLRVLEDMTMAIADLDFLVRAKGSGFSLRAALSLRACLEELDDLGLTEWDAIDLILVQEVLSKVRLLARDPLDESVLQDLKKWQGRHGGNLARCASMISEWDDMLKSGVDVVQV